MGRLLKKIPKKSHKTSHKSRGFHLFLTLAFLLPTLCLGGASVVATTQSEINDLKEKSSEIKAEKAELEKQLEAISQDKDQAVARKTLIEQEIQLLQDEIDNTEAQILILDGMIYLKIEEIQEAEEDEREQYELFCERVRVMEKNGQVSYWSILFAADSFADLLDRITVVDEIMAYDNAVMENLVDIRLYIEEERAALEVLRAEQEAIYLEQQAAREEKKAQEAKIDVLIAEISAQEAVLEAAHKELETAANSMDADIRAKEQELLAQMYSSGGSGIVSESGFMWPLTAYNTLSSLFGGRIHPITGLQSTHSGIDIPAPSGTPILSAKSGVVLISQYSSSYGHYVVVSHGDQSTLYAHMVQRGCSVGDTVQQGQVVGYVGTTGSSTGNHLHFEVRVGGTRYDPVNFFPDKLLYVRSSGVTQILNH